MNRFMNQSIFVQYINQKCMHSFRVTGLYSVVVGIYIPTTTTSDHDYCRLDMEFGPSFYLRRESTIIFPFQKGEAPSSPHPQKCVFVFLDKLGHLKNRIKSAIVTSDPT